MSIQTTNPFTNKVVQTYDEISEEVLEKKIQTAHKAYQSWKQTDIKERASMLMKVSKIMLQRKKELAKIITLEMGKRLEESEGEIEMCASVYEYYAKNAEKFLKDQPVQVKDGKAFIRYTPTGIILGVMPWNFPFNQVGRIAAPNIMAGNVMLVKHASNVPQCAEMIEQIFTEAGFPKGIYTNLFISSKRIAKMGEDPRITGMSLTGSEKAGASLAEIAGKNLKKSVLELGGNDAFIVLEDADIELAVEQAVQGRFGNMGQACTSSKRMIVVSEVYDEFVKKFQSKVENLKVGDPMDPETAIAPLSSEDAVKKIEKQVKASVKAGAKVVLGGQRIKREGAFFEFTILTNIKPGMPAYDDEIFGPVASIFKVKDEKAAIQLANDSSFGLGGSVFSKDIDRAVQVASQIDTGMVYINEHSASRPDLPFGGTKRSGYGTELSEWGIKEFVNKKLIRIG